MLQELENGISYAEFDRFAARFDRHAMIFPESGPAGPVHVFGDRRIERRRGLRH
ncbi:hypothetical protein [Burkholderia mayonis]|uniref:hypothetical protein n=1 Tax=Burkholderia mayonis TaxID=1385591 RepID=UPI00193A39B3|nr:hypothetical protein [Burkholderia mayonis]